MAYRTLGELKAKVLVRLGFGSSGAATGAADATVRNALEDAYLQLHRKNAWLHIEGREDVAVAKGQRFVDVPDALDPLKVQRLEIWDASELLPMWRGLETHHYSTQEDRGLPRRYEIRDQIRLWPDPEKAYTLVVTGTQAAGRFQLDGDRPKIDDHLVYLFGLANAKAHYRHPDAQAIAAQADDYLAELKADTVGPRVYDRCGTPEDIDLPYKRKPVVVDG